MNRILFLLNAMPDKDKADIFIDNMARYGVVATFLDLHEAKLLPVPEDGQLLVTDSPSVFSYYRENGTDTLVVIYNDSEFDLFSSAKYFVMEPLSADYKYYDRVYRRINELPWEMYRTRRLILRETTEADVDIFYDMYKDKRMTMYMEPLYEDIEAERKYVKEYRERMYSVQGFGIWTVVRKKDGKVIGRAGLNYRSGFDEVEIGFAIGTDYWNKGYATEAILSILRFAKKEKLGNVNALVMRENECSKHVLSKTGFKYVKDTVTGGILYEVWCCLV